MDLKFGTDGIRGPVQTEITPEVCLKIGHAAGIVLKEEGLESVMIGSWFGLLRDKHFERKVA